MGSSKANQIQRLMEERDRLRDSLVEESKYCRAEVTRAQAEREEIRRELKRTQYKLQQEEWSSYELITTLSRFVDWGRLPVPETVIHEADRQAQLVDIFDSAVSALIDAKRRREENDND